MNLIQLSPTAYQLHGGSNAGLVLAGDRAVLIDTGLDKDTARKILRFVEGLGAKLVAILVTHAHADHFGGAATIRARTGAPVYAPALERAVVENPVLEPLYLFSGAMPPLELRHKFTLADSCQVDVTLEPGDLFIDGITLHVIPAPGHAPNQMIVGGGGVCFVADAVFAPEVLDKHTIPFLVDYDQWQATLSSLPGLDGRYAAFVPGHGAAATEIGLWASLNAERLAALRASVARAIAASGTGEVSDIVLHVTADLNLQLPSPVMYWLTQTPVMACLASLQRAGAATVEVQDNRLAWRPAQAHLKAV